MVVDDMPGRGGKSERGRQKQRERQSTTMQADGQDHSLYRLQSSQLLQVSQLKKNPPSTQPAFSLPLTLPTILFPLDPSSKWLTRTKTENPQYHTHAHTHIRSQMTVLMIWYNMVWHRTDTNTAKVIFFTGAVKMMERAQSTFFLF